MVHRNGQLDWTGTVRFVSDRLSQPLRWGRPRRVFVNSLSDCFHPSVTEDQLDMMFCVMALCPQHTFQILTKRPERMMEYITTRDPLGVTRADMVANHAAPLAGVIWDPRGSERDNYWMVQGQPPVGDALKKRRPWPGWPLPNVHLGTSVENQNTANERIPYLLRTPAAVRFLSMEPLLEQVDLDIPCSLSRILGLEEATYPEIGLYNTLTGEWWPALGNAEDEARLAVKDLPKLDWVIVGGESGPGARNMSLEWAVSLRDQCKSSGTPFFFKQVSGPRSGMGDDALGELIHEFPNPSSRNESRTE